MILTTWDLLKIFKKRTIDSRQLFTDNCDVKLKYIIKKQYDTGWSNNVKKVLGEFQSSGLTETGSFRINSSCFEVMMERWANHY